MNPQVITAIKISILSQPHLHQLTPADVNPMLLVFLGHGSIEQCIEVVGRTLQQKVQEVLAQLPEQPAAAPETQAEVRRPAAQTKRPATSSRASSKPKQTAAESPATVKQIRFYGHLSYELGEQPDYKEFAKLSYRQASLRIGELQAKVKDMAAAG